MVYRENAVRLSGWLCQAQVVVSDKGSFYLGLVLEPLLFKVGMPLSLDLDVLCTGYWGTYSTPVVLVFAIKGVYGRLWFLWCV